MPMPLQGVEKVTRRMRLESPPFPGAKHKRRKADG